MPREIRAGKMGAVLLSYKREEMKVKQGINNLKKFIQRTAELWANAEINGAMMDQKIREAKERDYEKHGIYFRWRF